jgi:hypothetical protein
VPASASSASIRTIATAARFSRDSGTRSGKRVNAAQSSAIFRRVVSANGRIMRLDYITAAFDEMT